MNFTYCAFKMVVLCSCCESQIIGGSNYNNSSWLILTRLII